MSFLKVNLHRTRSARMSLWGTLKDIEHRKRKLARSDEASSSLRLSRFGTSHGGRDARGSTAKPWTVWRERPGQPKRDGQPPRQRGKTWMQTTWAVASEEQGRHVDRRARPVTSHRRAVSRAKKAPTADRVVLKRKKHRHERGRAVWVQKAGKEVQLGVLYH